MQFHTSAVIFLPIALLAGRSISIRQLVTALVLLGPVAGWLLGERLDVYADRYIEQIYGENASAGAWFRYALVLLPFFFFEWKRELVAEKNPEIYQLLRIFSLITFALIVVGSVSSVALHRMVYFVMPVSILAIVVVATSMIGRRYYIYTSLIPIIVYGAYLIVWFRLSSHAASCYIPYRSWLI